MTRRRAAGRRAQQRGAAWETAIRADLAAATAQGILRDWQQQGVLYQRIGSKGRRVVPIEAEAPTDFLAWSRSCSWMWEAKATGAERWSYAKLEAHQARRLTSWHMPHAGRVAGVALRFDLDRPVARWLPWNVLGPLWSRWAVGQARRGEASITVDDAVRLGTPWGNHWTEETRHG